MYNFVDFMKKYFNLNWVLRIIGRWKNEIIDMHNQWIIDIKISAFFLINFLKKNNIEINFSNLPTTAITSPPPLFWVVTDAVQVGVCMATV